MVTQVNPCSMVEKNSAGVDGVAKWRAKHVHSQESDIQQVETLPPADFQVKITAFLEN